VSIIGQIDPAAIEAIKAKVTDLAKGNMKAGVARAIFREPQAKALTDLETNCFDSFLGSSHYQYVLELEDKKRVLPQLDDFKVVRVLGEGGFGQVIEVVKRDCGARYAMKVMQKEVMKQNLGSSWRKKIASEQHIMSILHHPFMVNLYYAFQNAEFLILVMDIVTSGDLSEFVLTKKRLTPAQVNWVIMEVIEVMGYVHSQRILYRDLKPENILVDDEGHVRLIDMGLAAKITDKNPTRTSRVGTDCYMAPEVRWSRRRHQPYGASADWYTVGVLTYEFSHGALPFTARDTAQPIYRGGEFASPECKALTEGLLEQDWQHRLGTKGGAQQIKEHPYFKDVDWEIVSACTMKSPVKGVKGIPKRKKDKEVQAQRTAGEIAEADKMEVEAAHDAEYNIGSWDFVSPSAVTEEYMASMYQVVSLF
jgi:serine/threonine protein kinase